MAESRLMLPISRKFLMYSFRKMKKTFSFILLFIILIAA